MDFLLDVCVTAVAYLLVPFVFCFRGRKLTKRQINKIIIINGFCVWLIFSIIRISLNIEGNSFAVFLWSSVAYWFLKKDCMIDDVDFVNQTNNSPNKTQTAPEKAATIKSKSIKSTNYKPQFADVMMEEDYIELLPENDLFQNFEINKSVKSIGINRLLKTFIIFLEDNILCQNKRKGIFIAIIIFVIFIFVFINHLIPKSIEDVKNSVVMVESYDLDGNLIATGSGFCAYEENLIITNFHVIEGAQKITIITDEHREFFVDDIIIFSKSEDLAIIKIDGRLNPLSLGNGNKIKIKDKITTIGSPKGELNTVSEGIISNVDNIDVIRISAPISHGSSGGVLLNQKNEVIGITNAGYDDAQNLNFAISVLRLEQMYSKYRNKDYIAITDDNYLNYIGNLGDFKKYISSSYYGIESLSAFFILTDDKSRFEHLLRKQDFPWYSIYEGMSLNDKKQVVKLFEELCNYDFNNDIVSNIKNWKAHDFLIGLNILNEYEYAIAYFDVGKNNNKSMIFSNVNDNYPLGAAEKTLILYLLGEYEWDEIHTDNKKDIFEFFDNKYETEEMGAILEILGYKVIYESDGTLTAYW